MLYFKALNVQGERVSLVRREKEVTLKAEAGDVARRAGTISDARAADLELKLQQCMSDCDTLQLKVEDATQASGVYFLRLAINLECSLTCILLLVFEEGFMIKISYFVL